MRCRMLRRCGSTGNSSPFGARWMQRRAEMGTACALMHFLPHGTQVTLVILWHLVTLLLHSFTLNCVGHCGDADLQKARQSQSDPCDFGGLDGQLERERENSNPIWGVHAFDYQLCRGHFPCLTSLWCSCLLLDVTSDSLYQCRKLEEYMQIIANLIGFAMLFGCNLIKIASGAVGSPSPGAVVLGLLGFCHRWGTAWSWGVGQN